MNSLPSPSTGTAPAQLSVVIIGRNEGPRLDACLRSVRQAHWPLAMEIIYVDSGSSDASVALAASHGARTCVIAPPYSAAAARNAGTALAQGRLVLFLDGDTVLHPGFPLRALHALAEAGERTACVWGHRRESNPRQSVYTQALDLDWIFPAGQTSFCGGDALFRREALVQVGGFDASLIAGEEPELCRRLRERGWTILHIDAPMTRHDLGIRRFSQYWRRCERAGHAYASVSRRFAGSPDPLWQAESRRNVLHALVLLGLVLGPLVLALVLGLLPGLLAFLASGTLLALGVARTARRHQWKADSRSAALVYALHSHLQQFPILAGQLAYWLRHARSAPRALIEYR